MAAFQDIYKFQTEKGIVLPQTSDILSGVTQTFKDIFGNDLNTDPETPIGRMIEAISMLFINVLGVNAQNANALNPNFSAGIFLDSIGALFGVSRLDGGKESDESFRRRILESQSRGSGYVQSIRSAISSIPGVTSVVVLENGYSEPHICPDGKLGIVLAPHSIFVCVAGGDEDEIAEAVAKTKPTGCGYTTDGEFGGATVDSGTYTDSESGSQSEVPFFRPAEVAIGISISVKSTSSSSEQFVEEVKDVIRMFIASNPTSVEITPISIVSYVASNGIICTGCEIRKDGSSVESVKVMPYGILSLAQTSGGEDDIEVIVS